MGAPLCLSSISFYHRLYFPVMSSHGPSPSWAAIIVEPRIRKMYYLNPSIYESCAWSPTIQLEVETIANQMDAWLTFHGLNPFLEMSRFEEGTFFLINRFPLI